MEIKEIQNKTWEIINRYNRKNHLKHNKNTVFHHLVEEVGELARELMNEQNEWRAKFNKEKFDEEVVDVLMRILTIAKDYDVKIEEVFNKKIIKLQKRFELD